MQDICHNPKPTHNDMGLIPAQGRNMEAVQQDVADARAADQTCAADGPPQGPQWVYDSDDTEEE